MPFHSLFKAAAALLLLAGTAAAVDMPWLLGDEFSVACYTLSNKTDIPRPVGLEFRWLATPPTPMDATAPVEVQYAVTVTDAFWTAPTNKALLGDSYDKYSAACAPARRAWPNGSPPPAAPSAHSSVRWRTPPSPSPPGIRRPRPPRSPT